MKVKPLWNIRKYFQQKRGQNDNKWHHLFFVVKLN